MLDETVFRGARLAVVGNICRDVKTAPLAPDERLFRDGETPTDSIVETIGGGGANSALFAAALGAQTRFAGKVGDDALGSQLEEALRRRGVATFIRRDPAVQTGSSLVLTYTNGCRHFVCCQTNNYTFDFADVDLSILDGAGHLLRADVWFSEAMLAGGNGRILQAARDRGLTTSLDLNWDPFWGSAPEDRIQWRKQAVRGVLPLVDLVHGNSRELNIFADSTEIDTTLKRLVEWGAGGVVLHLGAQGAGYFRGGELIVEPSFPVQRQSHATGSGDLLSVCMMLLHERTDISIGEKLRLANRIVADHIQGARDFLPPL
jgi:sugar/nucleoside kinase (ribokinase family)